MIKQSFLTLLCLGLLGLSACSSEKKESMPAQAVEATVVEGASDVDAVTKVADNETADSEIARAEETERKEV
jgi:hypothetical protein